MEKYFSFTTSGTTKKTQNEESTFKYSKEKYFRFIEEILIPETFIEKTDTVLGLTTLKNGRHIHGSNIRSMCRMLKLKFYYNNKDYILFKNLINNGEISYLFCAPSFVMETKEFIDFKKIKKIQLVGEQITDNFKDYLLNNIFDKSQLITNNYGSTETNSIGYKLLQDDYFKLIKNSFLEKEEYGNFYFKSPYLSEGLDKYLIQDIIFQKDNKSFKVLGRKTNANFFKKNGKKILLDELNKLLYNKFKNILLIKNEIIIDDIYTIYNHHKMTILKSTNSVLLEEEIKKVILDNFYFEYLPVSFEIKEEIKQPNINSFKSLYL